MDDGLGFQDPPEFCSKLPSQAMYVAVWIVAFIAISTAAPIAAFRSRHGAVSASHAALAFFCGLNVLVCAWEIILGAHIALIQKEYRTLRLRYAARPTRAAVELLGARLGPLGALSPRFWSKIWSTYSLFDPSYASKESFGFYIDVGNGLTTLAPCALWVVGTTRCAADGEAAVGARALGVVGLLAFYQMWYGTLLYFASFVVNRRYKPLGAVEAALFVGLTNGVWFVFPLVGMRAALALIFDGDYRWFLG